MRRLLIKLVAVETALVGWLSYWLFLVYANNPGVSQDLASRLARFPQLSFTTVDISVLVIIGVLSTILAFKFQRGLKPGIRLERALQMLESLMKRNLVLEAQVAELKLEKPLATSGTLRTPSEPRQGSWERAFRTPLEAGLPAPTVTTLSPSPGQLHIPTRESIIDRTVSPQRPQTLKTEPRPVQQQAVVSKSLGRPETTSERQQEKLSFGADPSEDAQPVLKAATSSPAWEGSPKHFTETVGALMPSPNPPLGQTTDAPVTNPPDKTLGLRAKSLPRSVIVGPGFGQAPPSPKPLGRIPLRPSERPLVPATTKPYAASTPPPFSAKPPSPDTIQADQGKTTAIGDIQSNRPSKVNANQGRKRTPAEED